MGSDSEFTREVSVLELFVEVHHMRGNVSKFEIFNPMSKEWEEFSVWKYRPGKVHDHFWEGLCVLDAMLETSYKAEDEPHGARESMFRVTRYPALEKDMLDTTYHPSVDSRWIDLTYVKELFNNE